MAIATSSATTIIDPKIRLAPELNTRLSGPSFPNNFRFLILRF
jgi:hypothetical protein